MKGLIILADGFEDVEAIAVIDILKRADIAIDKICLNDTKKVTTSSNLDIVLSKSLKEINYKEYDFLVLPGGKATFNYLDKSYDVARIVEYFCEHKLLTCAICAAPMIIGKLGYLKDKEYTVFPGCGEKIIHGKLSLDPVVKDKNIITARSMYYANDFALEIVETIKGKEKRIEIEKQIKGLL